MPSPNHHETLLALCKRIAEQGQAPSVGLLRGQAPFKVSVIDAIEAIKRFNLQQQATPPPVVDDSTRIAQLEKRVKQLEDALVVIEERLAKHL